jgi:hypothetical protein
MCPRGPANSAPIPLANAAARASFHADGKTTAALPGPQRQVVRVALHCGFSVNVTGADIVPGEWQHWRPSAGVGVGEGIAERSCESSAQDIREGRVIGRALQQGFLMRLGCHGFAGHHRASAHQYAASS